MIGSISFDEEIVARIMYVNNTLQKTLYSQITGVLTAFHFESFVVS